jgi:hypothetical protein
MPYVILYKISKATGIPIAELVSDAIAEYWNSLWDEAESLNQPRGRRVGWRKGDTAPLKRASGYKKLDAEKPAEPFHVEPLPETVSQSLPKSVTAPKQAKKPISIADLMKASPAPETPAGEPEPDFSNISDELFGTSMDATNNPARRRK